MFKSWPSKLKLVYCGSASVKLRWLNILNLSECVYELKLTGPCGLWVIISHGVKPSRSGLWVLQDVRKVFVKHGENEICPLCVSGPPASLLPPPTGSQAGFGQTEPVPHVRGGSRWCIQVPPSPTREEFGVVHMCTGPSGALADEGLGCRRALNNVRGFGMRLKVPLGYRDPWHLLAGPCALFSDLRAVRTCGEILASLQLIQKFHLDTRRSGESPNESCTLSARRVSIPKRFYRCIYCAICYNMFLCICI